uniref:BHLH transcription factor n=1 Tax=Oryza sativa subsp. indica TaxID=39946 RepID=G9CGB1_ORYSI|nr:bHLH transcription factor [Oryza sativa Indica Group]ADY17844.1 bHLH transcription factor [Oryza sativa Indica Group]
MAGGEAQAALQAVAQSLRWTYSLLWQLCPHQGSSLVWGEGHYNGAVKTRKSTVMQPPPAEEEDDADHAARHRSRQLRELYDWLQQAGENSSGGVQTSSTTASRRPGAALSPEDLTETEWFFLMSASYSFPPGIGLPGRAFARRGHVWLTGANEVDSKVFLRAILAKSAGIQTVVCIPVVDGVLEIGTTEKVEEDMGLIQYARGIFMDQHGIHMKPTLSQHSTSNPVTHCTHQHPIQVQMQLGITSQTKFDYSDELNADEENDDTEEEGMSGSDTNNTDTERNSGQLQLQMQDQLNMVSNDHQTMPNNAVSSELMQCEMSEVVRDGCSNNILEDEIQMLMDCQNSNCQLNLQGPDEPCHSWHFLCEELQNDYQPATEDQVASPENTHYPKTLMTILHYNTLRQQEMNIKNYLPVSEKSSFSRWTTPEGSDDNKTMISPGTTQRMLKSILMIVPSSHCSYRGAETPESRGGKGASGTRKVGAIQGDFSANHVLKERRRREKLNEKFIILRSLVPFMTKMDKASILGDTIEYVKQLRNRIQELESSSSSSRAAARAPSAAAAGRRRKRSAAAATATAAEGMSSSNGRNGGEAAEVVQVSIIESDALLELRCGCGGGGGGVVLLRVMQAMQELQLEVTAVQASCAGGELLAELRAKVVVMILICMKMQMQMQMQN